MQRVSHAPRRRPRRVEQGVRNQRHRDHDRNADLRPTNPRLRRRLDRQYRFCRRTFRNILDRILVVEVGALEGLSRSAAYIYADWGIRCNVLQPGFIATKMTAPVQPDSCLSRCWPSSSSRGDGRASWIVAPRRSQHSYHQFLIAARLELRHHRGSQRRCRPSAEPPGSWTVCRRPLRRQ